MVDILMATHDGEKYIDQLIESILMQSMQEWCLIIKDDGSSDGTVEIIRTYCSKYPDKIRFISSKNTSGSAKQNFFELMAYSTNDYVMFCDQDDIWLPQKIEHTLNAMVKHEGKDSAYPLLIHTDLKVIDKEGRLIEESLYAMQTVNPEYFDRIERLLVQNAVTGCTMMINKALKNCVSNMPDQAIMHDWWLALHAMVYGKIAFLSEATILYRQHDNNVVGAKDTRQLMYWLQRINHISNMKSNIVDTYLQARALYSSLDASSVDKVTLAKILIYSSMMQTYKLKRIFTIIRRGYLKNSLLRRLGQLLLC